MDTTEFPIYRKYSNNKSYFKVLSVSNFIELKAEGNGFRSYPFEATIHPDRIFIEDMINNRNNHWLVIEASEYEQVEQQIID